MLRGSFASHPSCVVVTTYETVIHDRRFFASHNVFSSHLVRHFALVNFMSLCFFLISQWKYMVVDEGHRLKNDRCVLRRCLDAVAVQARLIVTGTPLSNSLGELWALLSFVLPELFPDKEGFERWFNFAECLDKAIAEKRGDVLDSRQGLIGKLHFILKPFMLRRKKKYPQTG